MFIEILQDKIAVYNKDNPDNAIDFEYAVAETQTEGIFEIRKLIRRAFVVISGGEETFEAQSGSNKHDKISKSHVVFKNRKREKKLND
ncbi:hypothetical protein SDC9_106799 [bioreactor metagenome]|uniref:Uncharacterized protein n=1 Tax=bioreactor metagenome TaxID=1076179 RepID=A0A645B9Y2_9ZZZZ